MKILSAMPPYNMFGLEETSYEKAKVVFLPVPYDSQTTYRSGAREGPHAIINASRQVELFSEELERDISRIGLYTLEELSPNLDSPEANVRLIEKEISLLLEDGKLPVLLGGDHSTAIGSIRAIAKKYKDHFSILHLDAHSDTREEFMGSKYNHACVMARAREVCKSCYSVGVRSTEEEGYRKYKSSTIYRKDMHKKSAEEMVDFLVKNTKSNVYLTLDFDVLDPGQMPSVGTPEPDGPSFYEITQILKGVFAKKTLVGADFVELSPIPGMIAPDFLAAKLIYLTLGYAFHK